MPFSLRTTQQCRFSLSRQTRGAQRRYLGSVSLPNSISLPESQRPSRFSRLSSFWIPTGGIKATEGEDGHAKLARAGYLRQSHAGIFHMLPLGLRVQAKLENLIDKHMSQLGASKLSLSSISSQALWKQTDRLEGYGQELFRFTDRKDVPYILAPTHEEEITKLVAKTIKSHKSLPLRLYQIGRKYRDEIRPRHGVLRSKEFVMKDLYTFDYSLPMALKTYEAARSAYNHLFDELKLPYFVAEASSGDIGGDLSHEYHLPSPIGEDNVISCTDCNYVMNEELATARSVPPPDDTHATRGSNAGSGTEAHVWRGVSKDRKSLINVWYPSTMMPSDINTHAIKSLVPGLNPNREDALPTWEAILKMLSLLIGDGEVQLLNIIDHRLGNQFEDRLKSEPDQFPMLPPGSPAKSSSRIKKRYIVSSTDGEPLNMIRIHDGDRCPRCESGELRVQKAIELGHTFHLGTKYSEVLDAFIQVPSALLLSSSPEDDDIPEVDSGGHMTRVPLQMGCHGIGVSRILGAVAGHLADERGLNWPRAIAPFEVVVIPANRDVEEDAVAVVARCLTENNEAAPVDLLLDDRPDSSLGWKLKDADLVGYPVIVILGRKWAEDRLCEVQCRRLGPTEFVPLDGLRQHVVRLLDQL